MLISERNSADSLSDCVFTDTSISPWFWRKIWELLQGYTKYSSAEPSKSRCQMFIIKTLKHSVLSLQFSVAQRPRGREKWDELESVIMPDTTRLNWVSNAKGHIPSTGFYYNKKKMFVSMKCNASVEVHCIPKFIYEHITEADRK